MAREGFPDVEVIRNPSLRLDKHDWVHFSIGNRSKFSKGREFGGVVTCRRDDGLGGHPGHRVSEVVDCG